MSATQRRDRDFKQGVAAWLIVFVLSWAVVAADKLGWISPKEVRSWIGLNY